ncbi:pumilio domain-containing protein [Xylaria flabelliformis]|nr:pumilio domain-containing protein [Xylaria flabelliformis]
MGPTTRPNGFPILHKPSSNTMDGSQRLGSISGRAWPSNSPWSNLGLPSTLHRDTSDSRGSDELSPTAPSGPVQSNTRNDFSPWSGLGTGGWPTTTGPEDVSPTHTRFPPRQSIGQSTSALHSHGIALPTLQTLLDPLSGEERANSGMYSATSNSQYGRDRDAFGFNRRNSADPNSANIGQNGSNALPSRQPEANTSRPMADSAQYAWRVPGHVNSQHQRPSFANASASDTAVSAPFTNGGVHANLEEFGGVSLEDTTAGLYAHRSSMDRGSSAGSSYLPRLNSPRNSSGALNPRIWAQPVPRSANMSQDLDRQQQQGSQYSHPPPGLYPPYFYSTLPVGLVPDHSPQSHNHRSQIPPSQLEYRQPFPIVPQYSFGTNRDGDPTQGARSALLEEFRSLHRTNRRFELKDIYGHIVEFSGDQHGSRFIQDRLKAANSEEKERVFQEISHNAVQLMKDLFGNYVIQRFFEHGDQVQKKLLAAAMIGRVAELSTQMYSCRVVQKALEHVLDDQQREIVDELRLDIVSVAKNANGNHVVQKAVQMFPKQCIPFIMNAFQGQIEHLATHQYACRIIQRILEYGTEDEKKILMADIHACAAKLMTDQYGNYVIQHIIDHGEPADRLVMIQHVIDRTLTLSRHKYASNVVEKCIERGTADQRRDIRSKLTTLNNDGTSPLQVMIRDQYGNYVVQKLLSNLKGPEKAEFALELSTYIPQLKKQGTSRQNSALDRLIAAIETVLNPMASTSHTNGGGVAATSAPSTPSLAVEVNSAVPTPLLTTEQNTPQSGSPLSTSIDTADEAGKETDKTPISPPDKGNVPVRVQEN